MGIELIDVTLAAVRPAAQDMKLYELRRPDGQPLPACEPGAHIDVHLAQANQGQGVTRQYSLVNHGSAPDHYLIGVKREAGGQGGSLWLHDQAREGMALQISAPRNHFPLHPQATHSILIAGGIGITPIFNMATQLQAQGRSWELHYGCRSQAFCAFEAELKALAGQGEQGAQGAQGDNVRFYFDDELGPGAIDFQALAARAQADAGTHLYCCGPQGMLTAYETGCAAVAPRAHLEHFSAPTPVTAQGLDTSFVVVLAKSGKEVTVPPDKTILACLAAIGIDVPYSCSQGVCGSCETAVLDGLPDHRDVVLSPEEQAEGKTMMVCCSRAKSERLTLNL